MLGVGALEGNHGLEMGRQAAHIPVSHPILTDGCAAVFSKGMCEIVPDTAGSGRVKASNSSSVFCIVEIMNECRWKWKKAMT